MGEPAGAEDLSDEDIGDASEEETDMQAPDWDGDTGDEGASNDGKSAPWDSQQASKRPADNTEPGKEAKRARLDRPAELGKSLRFITGQVRRLQPRGDFFDSFGRYIATLLRSLPRRKALLLQPQIVNLITVSAALNLNDRPLPWCPSSSLNDYHYDYFLFIFWSV